MTPASTPERLKNLTKPKPTKGPINTRVREYINNNRKKEVHELINGALNSTLSRTINTSLTTFVVLLIIFLFGGEVIRGFMFALMVGVIVGTYSSLFVASPIMLDTIKRKSVK